MEFVSLASKDETIVSGREVCIYLNIKSSEHEKI